MCAAATAAASRSGSSSTRTFAPNSTVSFHSVDGRAVTHGTPYQYASFWIPPESVTITRACEASAAKSRYDTGWLIRTGPRDSPSDLIVAAVRGRAGNG